MEKKLTTTEIAARFFGQAMNDLRKATDDLKARLEHVAPGTSPLIDKAVAKALKRYLQEAADAEAKSAVPSDMDHGREGDPQAIWNTRLGSLSDRDLRHVDDLEQILKAICAETGFTLERNLRGPVGWKVGRNIFVPVTEALDYRSQFHFEEAVRAAMARVA